MQFYKLKVDFTKEVVIFLHLIALVEIENFDLV